MSNNSKKFIDFDPEDDKSLGDLVPLTMCNMSILNITKIISYPKGQNQYNNKFPLYVLTDERGVTYGYSGEKAIKKLEKMKYELENSDGGLRIGIIVYRNRTVNIVAPKIVNKLKELRNKREMK